MLWNSEESWAQFLFFVEQTDFPVKSSLTTEADGSQMSWSSSREVEATQDTSETHGNTSTHNSTTCTTKVQSFLRVLMSHIISLNQFCKQLFSYPPPSARSCRWIRQNSGTSVCICVFLLSPKETHRPRGLTIMCWGPSVQRDQSLRGPWLNDGMKRKAAEEPQKKARTSANSFSSRRPPTDEALPGAQGGFVRFKRQRCSLSSAVHTHAESKFISAHCRMQIMWFLLFGFTVRPCARPRRLLEGFAHGYATQQRNEGLFWKEHWEKRCGRVGKSIEFNRKIVTIVWQTCGKMPEQKMISNPNLKSFIIL